MSSGSRLYRCSAADAGDRDTDAIAPPISGALLDQRNSDLGGWVRVLEGEQNAGRPLEAREEAHRQEPAAFSPMRSSPSHPCIENIGRAREIGSALIRLVK